MTEDLSTTINNLKTRRATITARLAALDGGLGDKPSANQPGSAEHVEYKDGLYRELEWIRQQLIVLDDELNGGGDGGAEIIHYGF